MNADQFNASMTNWMQTQKSTSVVFVQKGQVFTDSLVVAEKFGKSHDNVLRDIKAQLKKLEEAGESHWGVLNFEETQYQHPQNRQLYPKFDLTEKAFVMIAMGYTTPEAMKMKVWFLEEFNRMEQQLKLGFNKEDLSPQLQLLINIEQRTKGVEQDIATLKKVVDEEVWITELQKCRIREEVNKRLTILRYLGYDNAFHQGLYGSLKSHFQVGKYDKIPRKDFDIAISFIQEWYPKRRN
ncbi:Rha family transcriptional regulator [Paenibacillus alvei]|uniref:Rha family transcriptional regulator n=1 Tax=Paenibacillus alvei TaxID=44250 RepID=UPI002282D7E6|nr:Rha family transcriptional regulator [Paenibacillus alvei]MCY9737938.1 Rha family transcriptional regulator [Paenibacillus alvei]